jgi:hypothetical protein
MRRSGYHVIAIAMMVSLAGCQSYVAPGAGANLGNLMEMKSSSQLTDVAQGTPAQVQPRPSDKQIDDLNKNYELKPASRFPAYFIIMRLQDKGYESFTIKHGNETRGNVSVITVKDIEKDEDFNRFRKLAGIAQIGTLSPLLLPAEIRTDKDLRLAASRLQADILFLYTVDTKFWSEDAVAPLSVVTLGLSPSVTVNMVSTVSGVLMDVRTGYIYAMMDATEKQTQLSSWWTNGSAVDQSRQRTERAAFEKMLDEFEKVWIQMVVEKIQSK